MARNNLRAVTSQAVAKCRFDIGAAVVLGVVPYVAIAVLHASTAMLLILVFAFARLMPLVSAFQQSIQQVFEHAA